MFDWKQRLGVWGVTVAAMLYGFWGMFGRAIDMFRAPEEDMSFAWYVPLFSLYVVWSERAKIGAALRSETARPTWTGLLLSLPFCALALLGTRGLQVRFEQVAFMGLLVTVPWMFFGRQVARFFVFPALFLGFTIPVTSYLAPLTVRLRMLASGTALAVLNGCGVDAVQQGTAVISRGAHPFSIDVAEPCSGLRSLFALLALTAAYAWHNQPTWTRRITLFATALPLAVLGNVMRILTICLVALLASSDFALGFYHDYSGFVIFGVALGAMVGCGELMDRLWPRGNSRKAAQGEALPQQLSPQGIGSAVGVPILGVLLMVAFSLFQAATPQGLVMSAPEIVLPTDLTNCTVEAVRYCQNDTCTAAWPVSRLTQGTETCPRCGGTLAEHAVGEERILPSDTAIQRKLYHAPRGWDYLVTAVIGGVSKSSLHRPELCLPSQGFTMTGAYDFNVKGRPYHVVKLVPPQGGASAALVYTFANQAGFRTASHKRRIWEDTWNRSVHNRIDRWVMFTVFVSNSEMPFGFDFERPYDRAALISFLESFAEVLP